MKQKPKGYEFSVRRHAFSMVLIFLFVFIASANLCLAGGLAVTNVRYLAGDLAPDDIRVIFNLSPIGYRRFGAWSGASPHMAYGFRCVRTAQPQVLAKGTK